MNVRILLPLLVAGLALPAFAQSRTWTQAGTGRTLEGELKGDYGEEVEISLEGGRLVRLPLKMLSEEDIAYVEEWKLKQMESRKKAPEPIPGQPQPLPEGPVVLKLTGVHMCCSTCTNTLTIFRGLGGVDAFAKDGEVTIRAESGELAETAFRSIASRGLFGRPDNPAFRIVSRAGTDPVKSKRFGSVHLCCDDCVKHMSEVLRQVPGVEGYDVASRAKQIAVRGNFVPLDVVTALNEAGMNATPIDEE